MSDLAETLLPLERALAAGSGEAYRERLADEAVVIVPGAVLDRDSTVAAMDASPGWDDFVFEGVRALPLADDAGLLTYTFSGRRGDQHYRAVLSSVYVRRDGDWRMVLHQQTPVG
jgi:hypothetical protein